MAISLHKKGGLWHDPCDPEWAFTYQDKHNLWKTPGLTQTIDSQLKMRVAWGESGEKPADSTKTLPNC